MHCRIARLILTQVVQIRKESIMSPVDEKRDKAIKVGGKVTRERLEKEAPDAEALGPSSPPTSWS
jgi:hypothetical protein